jgi:hypothetical protein
MTNILTLQSKVRVTNKTESGVIEDLPDNTAVAPGIAYPSYKSLDDFVDVDRLRALDGYVKQRIRRRLQFERDLKFYTGPYTLGGSSSERPGSKMIYLSYSERPDDYFDLDKTELWHPTENANEFALLMEFIRTLPFRATGRMLIMYDTAPRAITPHRDHIETEVCHEFIWFRTNLDKPFFMLNHKTNEKKYVNTYTAWFDSVNQYHGSDGFDGLCFSVRVDGRFTDEFRSRIPMPPRNLASTPSFWALQDEGKHYGGK